MLFRSNLIASGLRGRAMQLGVERFLHHVPMEQIVAGESDGGGSGGYGNSSTENKFQLQELGLLEGTNANDDTIVRDVTRFKQETRALEQRN